MTQYIDKAAVKAWIERRIKETESMQPKFEQFWAGQISAFKGMLKNLDTLEVKEVEVDLEKEVTSYIHSNTCNGYFRADIHDVAEHFFELGLKVRKENKV